MSESWIKKILPVGGSVGDLWTRIRICGTDGWGWPFDQLVCLVKIRVLIKWLTTTLRLPWQLKQSDRVGCTEPYLGIFEASFYSVWLFCFLWINPDS